MRKAAEYSWSMKTSASASNRVDLAAPSSVCGARLVSSLIAPEPSSARGNACTRGGRLASAQLMRCSPPGAARTFRRRPATVHGLAWSHDGVRLLELRYVLDAVGGAN